MFTYLENYEDKWPNYFKFDRRNGILQLTVHTEGGSMMWSPLPDGPQHIFGEMLHDVGHDPENRIFIMTGTGDAWCPGLDMNRLPGGAGKLTEKCTRPGCNVQEPFVSGADTMIDRVAAGIPGAEAGFILVFSASPFPGHPFRLEWRREDGGGNWYYSPQLELEGWLCPALFRYFETAPPEIFAQVKQKPA